MVTITRQGIGLCIIFLCVLFPFMGATSLEDFVPVTMDRESSSVFDLPISPSSIGTASGTPYSVPTVAGQRVPFLVSRVFDDPPNPPEIEGPVAGKIRTIYLYNITVTDPLDESLIYLEVDFGDGSDLLQDCGCNNGPWPSGSLIVVEHGWKKQGAFQLRARVQDVSGLWSEWGSLEVAMAKSSPVPLWGLRGRLQGILPVFLG